jgi:hypothetical protein
VYRRTNLIIEREKHMTKSIDLKSFLLGGLLALVVAHVPNGEDYVLDTVNGQVWPRHVRGRLDASFYAPKTGTQKPTEPNKPDTR